ncbi:MAG TPA: 3-phosphoshikimate 1-carboxyvinyltransferase, partial [Actinomycetota bacterium]
MTVAEVRPAAGPLSGATRVPPDKSISHRAAILAALADGTSRIRGYSPAGDCAATLSVLRALGVDVRRGGDDVTIEGQGDREFSPPPDALDCERSGTTMRLMAGALAGRPLRVVLTGDPQLRRRPMDRVADPLARMGARIETDDGRAPVELDGGQLHGIDYASPVSSAQVKSALLLAGLRASGTTSLTEPHPSRDHTERMLAAMGAPIESGPGRASVRAGALSAVDVTIPGDLSSAAPLLAAAALLPGSDLTVTGVGVNPTRAGFLRVLQRMGADVQVLSTNADVSAGDGAGGEPVADVRVRPTPLRSTAIDASEAPSMIDEVPLIGVLATRAEGRTQVRGVADLRMKESDRIAALVTGLRALGARIEEAPDGFVVEGPTRLAGGPCDA